MWSVKIRGAITQQTLLSGTRTHSHPFTIRTKFIYTYIINRTRSSRTQADRAERNPKLYSSSHAKCTNFTQSDVCTTEYNCTTELKKTAADKINQT